MLNAVSRPAVPAPFGKSRTQGGTNPKVSIKLPNRPPNVPLLRALWSLLDVVWGLLKGSWGVLPDS